MKTQVNLVTGLLGSGKTVLLRHLLDDPWDKGKLGVVVGEFAGADYDGTRLQFGEHDLHVVTGTEHHDDEEPMLVALRAMVGSGRYIRVIMETSGVVHANRLAEAMCSDEVLREQAQLGRTVVVIDAGAFEGHRKLFTDQLFGQLKLADLIVLNHIDRVPDEEGRQGIRQVIREVNADAHIENAYMGQIRRQYFFPPFKAQEGERARMLGLELSTDELVEFESFLYTSELYCFDRAMFGHKLLNLPARVARFKGALRCYDKRYGVNGVPGQLDWEDFQPAEGDSFARKGWVLQGEWPQESGQWEEKPRWGSFNVEGGTSIALIGVGLDQAELTEILDAELTAQQTPPRGY